jgi:hypothetical protein
MTLHHRRLRPATVIPPDLYVQRAADLQLRDAIRDMGRPPYVLVSRQMGKTNLLIHAKRSLEQKDDLFVYLDISNRFPEPRAFFRHIIDSAVRLRVLPSSCLNDIRRARSKDNLPHLEYEASLRAILSHLVGRFVIILDEIDALTGSRFSDQVFSEIRSTYFSRTNYDDLQRLTYVLAGVAEPTDLIKDKAVSPFNIGEKIYLDDFTTRNIAEFTTKAGLLFPDEVLDTIFAWTGGNPRMVWDVCDMSKRVRIYSKV